jgi:hypothetical protein
MGKRGVGYWFGNAVIHQGVGAGQADGWRCVRVSVSVRVSVRGGRGGDGGSDPDLVGSFLASSGSAVGRTAGTEHCPGGWTGTVHLSIGKQAPCGCPRCCRRPPREAPGTYTEHFDRGGPECGPGKARCNGSPPWNPTSNIPWTDRLVYKMGHHLPMIVSRIASVNVHSSRCAASPSTCAAPKGVRWGDCRIVGAGGRSKFFCFSWDVGGRTSHGSIKPSAATALNLTEEMTMPR